MTPEELMRRAIALADENVRAGRGGPFGAVVVRAGVIVGEGANEVTTTNDPTAHAEVVAIRNACRALGDFRLAGCEIYASCEPCPMCLGAIYWARPRCLFYAASKADAAEAGFDDAFIYEEAARPAGERRLPTRHVEVAQARLPFVEWKRSPRRVPY